MHGVIRNQANGSHFVLFDAHFCNTGFVHLDHEVGIWDTGLLFRLWGVHSARGNSCTFRILGVLGVLGVCICTQLGVVCWWQVQPGLSLHSNICRNIHTCAPLNLHKSPSPHFFLPILCSSGFFQGVQLWEGCAHLCSTCSLVYLPSPVHSGHNPTIAHLTPQVDTSPLTVVKCKD